MIYTALQIAMLTTRTKHPGAQSGVSIASAAISLVSALILLVLSHLEHTKSVRPSSLISLFLVATVVFDATRVRTQWLDRTAASGSHAYASILTASLAVKCLVLILESVEKRSLLLALNKTLSKESTSGVLSRSSFWWLNTLLLSGFRSVLTTEGLPEIYEKLDSAGLVARLELVWDNCKIVLLLVCFGARFRMTKVRPSKAKARLGVGLRLESAMGDPRHLYPKTALCRAHH